MAATAKFVPPGEASLSNATSGTGKAIALNDCRQVSWKVTYTSGSAPTAGTVVIEQYTDPSFAGTWNQLDSISCANLSAGTEGFGTYPGEVDFVRARITSNPDQAINVFLNGLLG